MSAYYAKPSRGSPLNWADPLAGNLKLAWRFDDRAGLKVYDAVGRAQNNGNGIVTGIASPYTATSGWTGSRLGGGLALDGTDDGAATGNKPFPSATTLFAEWTLACGVVLPTLPGNFVLFGYGLNSGSLGPGGFYLAVNDGTTPGGTGSNLALFSPSGTNIDSGFTLAADTLYHCLVTRYGGTVYCYLNGVAGNTSATTPGSLSSSQATVGTYVTGGVAPKYGAFVIDYGYLWNRRSSQADAAALAADPYRMFREEAVPVPLLPTIAAAPIPNRIVSANQAVKTAVY